MSNLKEMKILLTYMGMIRPDQNGLQDYAHPLQPSCKRGGHVLLKIFSLERPLFDLRWSIGKLCSVQTSSRADRQCCDSYTMWAHNLSPSWSGVTIIYSCCLVSKENYGAMVLGGPQLSPAAS